MAVSGYLSAELAATCNALGFYDGQKYHLEPHCKETIRDLIRYLRRDEGGSHEIRRYLGNAKLLQTDLLPMVQCHHQDVQLFDIALRLIVNLTNPALLVYNEVIPTDKFEHNYYLEIVSHLQLYKEAFNDHRSWAPFTERLSVLLGKPVEDRNEDDQRTIERILILIRNLLHVPSSADQDQRPDNDASIHDQVLWGLHQSGMIDLLLYISSSEQENMFFMHLLEILCLMLREQPPELLAKTASQRSAEEKNKDDEELLRIRQAELQAKSKKHKKYFGTRHSNFGGTFVIKNLKSTSDNNDLIYHKPVHDSKYISLDTEKKPVKLPKNRQPLKCESVERKSALSVRLILKQVCVEFLNAAYNPLMLHVRECFHRGRAQENDESYYFTAMRFFMEFNRHYNFQVKYVSETMSVQTFQFIQKYLEQWYEMMVTDKKKLPLWSYRSHLALRAYKELLYNLAFMDRSSDESVRESSKVIKSNIFYVVEYREMLLTLVNTYKREKYSRKYLIDLVETIHIFMKLLCDFGKDKKMVIQKTAARRKNKSKNKTKSGSKQDQASAETIWNLACDDVALALTSPVECDVVPFDATLDLDMDQQKLEAIKKIQFHLKNGDYKQAVAMLRASREVWPENDTFGTSTADTTEELDILRDIFLADLGTGAVAAFTEEAHGSDADGSEEEESYSLVVEKNFEVIDFVKRFASPKVVKVCNSLLSTYDTNSETTNHCVVKLLYRIAFECKLPAMLFQASLLIKFRNILANYDPKHKELAKLAVYITRKFTEVAETNKTVFVELLFPKHVKDACEIVDGYGSYQDSKNKRIAWEEHEEEELKRLDEEYRSTNEKEDKVDWIMKNLINQERSKRGVVKKMKELGLEIPENKKPKSAWDEEEEEEVKRLYEECDKDMPEKLIVSFIHERMTSKNHSERSLKKKMYDMDLLQKPVKKLKVWTEDQDEDLTELFNLHKHDDDVMRPIMAVLGNLRSRQNVVSALLRLGLIADKDEVRKKSKSRQSRQADSDDEDSDEESDDDEDVGRQPKQEDRPPLVGPSAAALHREMSRSKYILGGLKWLVMTMNDNVEDLDADVFDADVPLLPLSEDPVLSMENPVFKDFLHAIGFKKPVEHQEVYWRVSSTWKETDFRTRIDVFNFLIENHERSLEDFASDFNQKLTAAVGEDVDVLRTDAPAQNSDDHANPDSSRSRKPPKECAKKTKPKKKSNLDRLQHFLKENDDDGSDSDVERDRKDTGSNDRSQRRRLSSDSEEEVDGGSRAGSGRSMSPRRNGGDSDSGVEDNPIQRMGTGVEMSHAPPLKSIKKRSLLDSDDETGPSGNEKPHTSRKKRRFIDSDEDMDSQSSQPKAHKKLRNGSIDSDDGFDANSKSSSHATASSRRRSTVIDSDDDEDCQVSAASHNAHGSSNRSGETPHKLTKKKTRAIESDDDIDSQISESSKSSEISTQASQKSKVVDSDRESGSQCSAVSKSPLSHHKSEKKSKTDESARTVLSRESTAAASTAVTDSPVNMDSQMSPSSKSSDAFACRSSEIPRENLKKKSRGIESDDDMDSQTSVASKSSKLSAKSSQKSNAVDSDDDMESTAASASSSKQASISQKKAKSEHSEDDGTEGPAVPNSYTTPKSAKKTPKVLKKQLGEPSQLRTLSAQKSAKKCSSPISDDDMSSAAGSKSSSIRVKMANKKKRSRPLDSDEDTHSPPSTKKRSSVNSELRLSSATKKCELPDTDDELNGITSGIENGANGSFNLFQKKPTADSSDENVSNSCVPQSMRKYSMLDSSDDDE